MVGNIWDSAKRKAHANMCGICPLCHKPYFQAGNYKPDDICQCDKILNIKEQKTLQGEQ